MISFLYIRPIDLGSFNSLVTEAYALWKGGGEMKHNNTRKSNKGGSRVSRKIDVAERVRVKTQPLFL